MTCNFRHPVGLRHAVFWSSLWVQWCIYSIYTHGKIASNDARDIKWCARHHAQASWLEWRMLRLIVTMQCASQCASMVIDAHEWWLSWWRNDDHWCASMTIDVTMHLNDDWCIGVSLMIEATKGAFVAAPQSSFMWYISDDWSIWLMHVHQSSLMRIITWIIIEAHCHMNHHWCASMNIDPHCHGVCPLSGFVVCGGTCDLVNVNHASS